ncbi:hypothetical protein XU18_2608 [Perkinsela sp. CCAP 1560/4]|nr:hypothetical protein XU18_2608 [Perkinsela sp. CCAP 1560/4]|eukprot:KNH06587.1 hypothetical protein XU18_2608 [Perkinsela sp. CCAP 1560/4]
MDRKPMTPLHAMVSRVMTIRSSVFDGGISRLRSDGTWNGSPAQFVVLTSLNRESHKRIITHQLPTHLHQCNIYCRRVCGELQLRTLPTGLEKLDLSCDRLVENSSEDYIYMETISPEP